VALSLVSEPGGSLPARFHARLDGGSDQVLPAEGEPPQAIFAVPEGAHTLEYWGEDAVGNQESPHRVVSVRIDTTPPSASILADRGFSSYEIGDHASVTITARDANSGLVTDPSRSHVSIPTVGAGHYKATITATDRCANASTASFAFSVVANPRFARSLDLEPRAGRVSVELPRARKFVALTGARQVPVGTIVETSGGTVAVTAAGGRGGRLQTGTFRGGRFQLRQARSGRGVVLVRLIDRASTRICALARARKAISSRLSDLGVLRASARGRFRTIGRYASATVHGHSAAWSVGDRCGGTLTRVTRGRVTVREQQANGRKLLRAGQAYLTPAP
jgi:hypothetical protein